MTRDEAIAYIKEHKLIAHKYFDISEYITINERGEFIDEKENKLDWKEFWEAKSGKWYRDGWCMMDPKLFIKQPEKKQRKSKKSNN